MKSIVGFILAVCCLGGSLQSQDLKQNLKTYKAFISISHQDIKGTAIIPSLGKQIEKCYAALGDRVIISTVFLKDLLFTNKVIQKDNAQTDSVYLELLSRCPKICMRREADPILLCLANFLAKLKEDSGDISIRYPFVLEWQRSVVPNAPWGINEPPEGITEIEEMEWGISYTRRWMKSYPQEYESSIIIFERNFNKWKSTRKSSTYKDYLEILVTDFTDKNAFSSIYFTKEQMSLSDVLPDKAMMQRYPENFVNEMYETLLLRKPEPEEIDFLVKRIRQYPELSPQMIYFSLMTSKEYNFY